MAEPGDAITHRRVLRIAFPIVISNATVPLLGLVDTGVVGQMGEAAPIGAVGIGAIILTALYWVFGFLRMGTTGLTSQAHGAGDTAEVAAMLTRALLIGFAGGFGLIALQLPLFAGAFWLSPASAEVETLAREYMTIRIWSAPAVIALFGITGWLIAQERTGAVLILQLVMNAANIGLNLWFVLGLEWGVAGVAWASFLAEWGGLALGLWLCRGVFGTALWRDWTHVLNGHRLRRMMAVNRDILLRSLMLEAVFVSFLFTGGDFGDATLAANQVLLQFLHVTSYMLDGFAFAAETLVGQAVGQKDRARLRRSAILSSLWGLIVVLGLSLVFAIFGGAIIDLLTTASDVREEARDYLVYIVAVPVLSIAAYMLDGIFVGAARAADMRNMMAISLAIYVMAALALVPQYGNHGLWFALLISFVARAVTLAARYPKVEGSAIAQPAIQ